MLSPCSLYRLEAATMPLLSRLRLPLFRASTAHNATRAFTCSATGLEKSLPPRRVLLDSEIIENFLKGSGPGGQKINKTSSAVQLKHIPTGIVVKYQDTRSRTINRKMARKILQERIEEMELGDDARTRVKAREKSKKKASADKKKRRKYRKLGEGEAVGEDEGGEADEAEVEVEGAVEQGHTAGVESVQANRPPGG
jgi:protein subunit release factor B